MCSPCTSLSSSLGEDPIGPEIADEIRTRSDSPPKGYMFSVVKVHLGNSTFTLFSPSTALHMAFEDQYFSDDGAHDGDDMDGWNTLGDLDVDYDSESLDGHIQYQYCGLVVESIDRASP